MHYSCNYPIKYITLYQVRSLKTYIQYINMLEYSQVWTPLDFKQQVMKYHHCLATVVIVPTVILKLNRMSVQCWLPSLIQQLLTWGKRNGKIMEETSTSNMLLQISKGHLKNYKKQDYNLSHMHGCFIELVE